MNTFESIISSSQRATQAHIHLKNLDHNLHVIREFAGSKRKICAAVKADAYGHGSIEVSKRLLAKGVDFLAVATVDEAILLREAGITAPIILFSFPVPEEIDSVIEYKLSPFVGSADYIKALAYKNEGQETAINLHLKIDTGMGRIGCKPEDAADLAKLIIDLPNVELEGVCTHFPVSDSIDPDDKVFTKNQIALFDSAIESIRKAGIDPGIVHAANSGAIAAWPEAHYDMVRPGIMLYGYYPDQKMDKPKALKPVMELRTQIAFLKTIEPGTSVSYGRLWTAKKTSIIASLPLGYADGYNRLLSNKSKVLIDGLTYPIAGRVCMDQFMVDLGDNKDINLFDDVVLFGPDSKGMDAAEIGEITGTIPYEVTCAISKRVPRVYQD